MRTETSESPVVAARIVEAAQRVGADVFAHAIDIDSGREIGIGSDELVVAASVFKVPVLVEYVRQVADGELDASRRIRAQASASVLGPTGLSVFRDDAEWSLRDVATSMITVSDNTASDIVTGLVGRERVNATMTALGLPETTLVGDCASLLATLVEEVGEDELTAADSERVSRFAVCTPARTNRTTAREAATLLQLLWLDRAGTPEACAEARRILGLQVWPHRLSTGFPRDDVRISGKTGTIGIVRNEIGVVEFPDGRRHAIAVFVRTHEYRMRNPEADSLIGAVGRMLSEALG